jgi:hypothetical protein
MLAFRRILSGALVSGIVFFLVMSVFNVMGQNVAATSDQEPVARLPDCFYPPDLGSQSRFSSVPGSPEPGFYDTSEYMIGSDTVKIIFVESDGTIDADTETWTDVELNDVFNETIDALIWWSGNPLGPGLSGWISAEIVTTSYEPISRPQSDEGLWISEIMGKLGYTSGSYFERVRTYDNYLREHYGTDWAYTMFVVDSSNDADGQFTDGYSAYAYLGGPFMVMTYDNDGWGIGNMDRVAAHEIGHIYYATDEYDGVSEFSGYLNSLEVENSGCLMDNNNLALSIGTLRQIGWVDTDSDGIFDIVSTEPEMTLNPYSPDPTNALSLPFSGTAVIRPYPNLNPIGPGNDVTVANINAVFFSLDGSGWMAASPSDGQFDEAAESLTFSISPGNGVHDISVMAVTDQGVYSSSYAYDEVTIDRVSPSSQVSQLPLYQNTSSITIAASASDNLGMSSVELWYSRNEASYVLYSTLFAPPWQWQFSTSLTGGEGSYEFFTVAEDVAGNKESQPVAADANTVIDLSNPVSQAFVSLAMTNSSSIEVTASASDNIGLSAVELWYRSPEEPDRLLSSLDSPPWHWTFNASHFGGDGEYKFYSRAIDLAGNYENPPTVADVNVTVDCTAPVSRIISAPSFARVSNVDISAEFSDATGVSSLSLLYSYDGGSWQIFETLDEGPWNFSFPFASGEGKYQFVTRGTDLLNNTEDLDLGRAVEIGYDVTAPEISDITPGQNSWLNVSALRASWSSYDEGSGVQTMFFQLDGGSWIDLGENTSKELSGLGDGEHEMSIRCTDRAGNEAQVSSEFGVDTVAPSITDLSPTGDVAGFYVEITWDGTDDVSGIDRYEVSIDSAPFESVGGQHSVIENLTGGQHTVRIRAVDMAGNVAEREFSFSVTGEAATPSGIPWELVVLSILAIAVILAIVVMFVRRK